MTARTALVFLLTCLVTFTSALAEVPDAIPVRVDRRVELVSIVFRLAGNPEYNMANSKSPYADDVEAHFGEFRDHAAVLLARELRRTHGISYDAVMSLAVHLDDNLPPAARTPLAPRPALLESRWTEEDAGRFIAALGDFSKDADAARFFDTHAELYQRSAERLSAIVNRQQIVPFFDKYFGQRQTASYTVIVGMLCGGGNYGMSMRYPDGREEITPVIGIYKWDANGLPAIGNEVLDTLFHEFCHAYTNAVVERHWSSLQKSAAVLFSRSEAVMRKRAYGEPRTLAYESLVRACVARAMAGLNGEPAGHAQAIREACGGFPWTIGLADSLKQYEADRTTYPTFDDFMPLVCKYFDQTAADYDTFLKQFPQVVSITPVNGSDAVDAVKATQLTIVFDRPMRDKTWSIVTLDRAQFPQISKPAYDESMKVLRVPLKLDPGRTYTFGLNGANFAGFQSADGYPLLPLNVRFKTMQ